MKKQIAIVFGQGLVLALMVGFMIGFSPVISFSDQVFASGSDDFNDNTEDLTKWGTDIVDGKGVLTEINQRLEYTTTGIGTADHDSVDRPWISTRFPYSADWAIQIDVTNTTTLGEFNSFGIDIASVRLPDNEIEIELAQSGQYWAEFRGGTQIFGQDYKNFFSGVTSGAIQIGFDSETKTFIVSYDTDPSDGYQWQPFGTFRVDGLGVADNIRNWGLTDSDQFIAYVFGYSIKISVPSGELYGDNFLETGGVEPASIEITSPLNGSSFDACSYFNPPLFQWTLPNTFQKLELQFYTNANQAKPTKVKVKNPAATQLVMPAKTWSKILKLPGPSGGELNWKIVGMNKGQDAVESDVFTMTVAAPEPVQNPAISPVNQDSLPTLTWGNACATKFKVYFGPDIPDPKIKKLTFTDQNPLDNGGIFSTTLTEGTWNAIRKLVDYEAGSSMFFYVESWDVLKRYQKSDDVFFNLGP
jgi:hypothetical protein